MKQPSFHDVEKINAYLDDTLDAQARASLERRLGDDPQLAAAYQSMRESRSLLRRLPQRRAPRNFTLTPKMAGIRPPLPRAYPVFRFASVIATLLFVFTFALNAGAPMLSARPAAFEAAPMMGVGGGPEIDQTLTVESAAAPEERPQSGGGCEGADCPTPQADLAAPAATPDQFRSFATEAPPAEKEPGITAMNDPQPAPVQPVVPVAALGALIGAAALFGGAALFVRWRADSAFAQRLKQQRKEQ